MKVPSGFRKWISCLIVLLLLSGSVRIVQGQSSSRFSVTFTGQTLTAGFNNTVSVTATNSYSSGSIYPSSTIYDVDLAVDVPTPLQMPGDSHWHYNSIGWQQSVNASFQVYAPTAAIGSSYQGSVTLTYRQLGDISYTQETHTIGFTVQGWIKLVLYGIQVTPSSTSPGGNTTVSGNILNSGNLAAYNANVTIQSEAQASGTSASVFLGEIDPNIPRPFSLQVYFNKNLTDGTYPIIVSISAIDTDRPASPYSAQSASSIQIKTPVAQPTSQSRQPTGIVGMIIEILRYLYGLFFGFWTEATAAWPSHAYFNATAAFILAARYAG
jgi:hypothetical protein